MKGISRQVKQESVLGPQGAEKLKTVDERVGPEVNEPD